MKPEDPKEPEGARSETGRSERTEGARSETRRSERAEGARSETRRSERAEGARSETGRSERTEGARSETGRSRTEGAKVKPEVRLEKLIKEPQVKQKEITENRGSVSMDDDVSWCWNFILSWRSIIHIR